jgi:hypothetical protein
MPPEHRQHTAGPTPAVGSSETPFPHLNPRILLGFCSSSYLPTIPAPGTLLNLSRKDIVLSVNASQFRLKHYYHHCTSHYHDQQYQARRYRPRRRGKNILLLVLAQKVH